MHTKFLKRKKFFLGILFLLFLVPFAAAHAVSVKGYYRSDGTYVAPYERTAPDGNPYNNYSYPGNYNPNTGLITGGDPATYLSNYYGTSGSSYISGYTSGYSSSLSTSCPVNSYYDGISSCKCSYGYLNSSGSCVLADTLCHQQVGYSSSYDSLSNSCKCNSGYVISSSGQCTSATLYCSQQIGIMSQYNSSTKSCECMSGYQYNGSSCVYQSSISSYSSTLSASVSNALSCQAAYGSNSTWDGTYTSGGLLNCACQTGYVWNSTKTSCMISSSTTGVMSNGLTMQQVNAIISLLQSFNAEASVIASVQTALLK